MLDRTERRFGLKPKRLAADTAYGTGRFLGRYCLRDWPLSGNGLLSDRCLDCRRRCRVPPQFPVYKER